MAMSMDGPRRYGRRNSGEMLKSGHAHRQIEPPRPLPEARVDTLTGGPPSKPHKRYPDQAGHPRAGYARFLGIAGAGQVPPYRFLLLSRSFLVFSYYSAFHCECNSVRNVQPPQRTLSSPDLLRPNRACSPSASFPRPRSNLADPRYPKPISHRAPDSRQFARGFAPGSKLQSRWPLTKRTTNITHVSSTSAGEIDLALHCRLGCTSQFSRSQ